MFKRLLSIIFVLALLINNVAALEADVFVQSTVNRASKLLSDNISKEEKIEKLKLIAKDTVDIEGIGFYTLGSVRKDLSDDQKKEYAVKFEEYFLKSFSSRLAEYTNPEIDVFNKEVLNENYTIVNSTLKATSERPEIKIDWRIYTKNPKQPVIRDLIIEGLSLARTQKEEFASVLSSNNGDINALFKTLEEFSNK
ncbi:ABC transporter substrate-binding protein [Candidatus Pelagibacter sp.]|jgi:phospholipid transport system substrate-binding protein|nr:ABC transporter substrate-binding protein [Candidatus Pelagibacter sp.]